MLNTINKHIDKVIPTVYFLHMNFLVYYTY